MPVIFPPLPPATSYAPGHNFWPGSPASWYFRGALAFLIVAGPSIAVGSAGVFICRRFKHPARWVVALAMVVIAWANWPHMIGLRFSDGDMPVYRGLLWGDVARPWIALAAGLACIAFTLRKRPEPRGFPVS